MYYSSISHLFVLGTGLLSASIVTAQQQNTTQPDNAPSNPQVQITNPNDFCLFLPPQPGLEVAINEDNGVPFCLNPTTVQGSKPFPEGFITTAHYYQSDTYTQVTGFFDRTKYNLNVTDEGGQYDSHAHHKPTGASCQNFPYFVSLIEPSNNRFCIRCCQDTEDCKTGISQRGCARVISPGNYDDNNQFDSVPPQQSSSGASGPTASSSAPPPPPSNSGDASASDSGSAASSSPAPTGAPSDDGSDQSPPAGSSPSPSPSPSAGGQTTDETTTDGGDTGNDASTGNGDDSSSTDGDDTTSEKQIPNTSYSSVSNDLDNSSSTFSDDNSNSNNQGSDIKTVDEEAKFIQSQLANPQVDLNALKTQFSTFTTNLATRFPKVATKVKKLASMTSNYQTADEWRHLANALQQKAPGGASKDEN